MEEADVHVLLAMRDDFLFRCHALAPLAAVFHDLTPLGPPSQDALRQALVEPAARRGVRFEEQPLVDDMLDAAGGERGALPLLAFAVSRLWEERSRESKLMTREAYERIGGVAGALAQHAEATLFRLGPEREGTVRELFRNLVTAEGTRAAREREELLSVFPVDGPEAGRVLDALVDARLLTEYEAVEAGSGARQIEIAHESLLSHWPRLVRWRTQEADGAQLRDQLRQAARLWDERGRPEGLVWAGAAHLDYRAWRARYPGRLSSLEEDFARAMVGLADRRRRRLRIAWAALVAAMAVGLGVLTTFWARSETARRKADAAALRAEASKLLALGQNELDRHPTAALAYAIRAWSWPTPTRRGASRSACCRPARPTGAWDRRKTRNARWASAQTGSGRPCAAGRGFSSFPGTAAVPSRSRTTLTSGWALTSSATASCCSAAPFLMTDWSVIAISAAGRCPNVARPGGGSSEKATSTGSSYGARRSSP